VWAVVTPSEQAVADLPDPDRLRAALTAEVAARVRDMAPFKRPAGVTLHDGELPKTTTRKVLRGEVAAWLSAQKGEGR
jgi:acyl-coenzyme A synthetase/AMP-(fatty) acid ligase